jgi:hypothetical protein
LSDDPEPDCVYFVKDVSRNCEIVDYNKAWWYYELEIY